MFSRPSVKFLLATLLFTTGCSYFSYMPTDDTVFRFHPTLNIQTYNQSGGLFSDEDWSIAFERIERAYDSLDACVQGIPDDIAKDLKARPIIITSPNSLRDFNANAITDLNFVFIRSVWFFPKTIQHEWLHIYLYLKGTYPLGDIFHTSELFKECAQRLSDN